MSDDSKESNTSNMPAQMLDALNVETWHRNHILRGLKQADAGEFATDDEVAAAFAKCGDAPSDAWLHKR